MMTHKLHAHFTAALRHATFGACLTLGIASASAQGTAPTPAASDLPAQATSALAWANELAADASQSIERWLVAGSVNEDRLFDRLYFPIQGASPPKFTTTYDALADRDFP